MHLLDSPRQRARQAWDAHQGWFLITLMTSFVILVGVALIELTFRLRKLDVFSGSLLFGTALLLVLVVLYTRSLRRAQQVQLDTEEELQQMASNIEEIFWTIDAETKRVLYVNEAYERMTGRSCRALLENPSSYEEVIHPEDRLRVLAKLEEATQAGHFDERFRIVCLRGEIRWVRAHASPVRDAQGRICRLVGTVQEVTAQKKAEDKVASHLAVAESAWAESDALRKATLALTGDLRMDFVMDALLRSLAELVPYTCARVVTPEGGPHLLALGEKLYPDAVKIPRQYPLTLNADESAFLQRVLAEKKSVLLKDTKEEEGWKTFQGHEHLRSWLSVPLVSSDEYLGFLSVGHTDPNRYTAEDLRRAELLAVPAAAAIMNSRLYEVAQIYGSELERRLADLDKAKKALEQAEEGRRISEDKFQKVFRSSPIPFSITTLDDGRFVDVNSAWERHYGYSRAEVIGRPIAELRIWEDPKDRELMIAHLQKNGPIRHVITRLRTKSGEIRTSAYSADKIQFDGQSCILAVSEDVPNEEKPLMN